MMSNVYEYKPTNVVIKIYDSNLITSKKKKREILEYIINSDEGKEYGLSMDDINYYLKEWSVHNYAFKHPKTASKITGQTIEDAQDSAEHVNLNTNDSHASIYKNWGWIFEIFN